MKVHHAKAMVRQLLTTAMSPNAIAKQRGMSHHTVRRYRAIATKAGLTADQLEMMSDSVFRSMFRVHPMAKRAFVLPRWEEEIALIGTGMSRFDAHGKYVVRVGADQAIAYRTYCLKLSQHQKTLNPILRIEHVAGYAMQTDYAGYAVPGTENGDAEPKKFKLFIATLPYSRLIAASIVRTETVADHIAGNVAALTYFGGAAKVAVPDNLKAAVIARPLYGPPRIQEIYQAFADHYGMGVMPARPRRPQDKSAVENAVKLIQRSLRLRVNERPLMDFGTLQRVLAEIVEYWNDRPLKRGNGHSRRSLFEANERMHLTPLPDEPFEIFTLSKPRIIQKDYHVEFGTNFYSVPHRLIGQQALVRASENLVEVLVDGVSVATHARSQGKGMRITAPKHRPSNHSAEVEGDLVEWAKRYCSEVAQIAAVEAGKDHMPVVQQQRLRWIKGLPRAYSRARFEAASKRAVALRDLRFEHVENVLKRGIEISIPTRSPNAKLSPQRNIRGADYFRKGGSGND
jgi:transposase